MKNSKLFLCIFTILLIILVVKIYSNYKNQGVNVPKKVLFYVLPEGNFKGTAKYGRSNIYKNGLKLIVTAKIKHHQDGVVVTNTIEAYDLKTNKYAYFEKRVINYDYKLNHGLNVFRNTKSYVNNRLVSSSHGKIVSYSPNSITILSNGSWHISTHEHTIKTKISRVGNKLISKYINNGPIPILHDVHMTEIYDKV